MPTSLSETPTPNWWVYRIRSQSSKRDSAVRSTPSAYAYFSHYEEEGCASGLGHNSEPLVGLGGTIIDQLMSFARTIGVMLLYLLGSWYIDRKEGSGSETSGDVIVVTPTTYPQFLSSLLRMRESWLARDGGIVKSTSSSSFFLFSFFIKPVLFWN